MSELFLGLYSSGELFCTKTYLEDLITKPGDSRFLDTILGGLGSLAASAVPGLDLVDGLTSLVTSTVETVADFVCGDEEEDDWLFGIWWPFLNEHQHPNPEVCTSLRRYMNIVLRSMEGQCEDFPREGGGN